MEQTVISFKVDPRDEVTIRNIMDDPSHVKSRKAFGVLAADPELPDILLFGDEITEDL
jgi:hypothetical protein